MAYSNSGSLGATLRPDGSVDFLVWAPNVESVAVKFPEDGRTLPMQAGDFGYFALNVPDVRPGTRYFYRLDDEKDRPDPASRHQPDGPHGPSAVLDLAFDWTDGGFSPPSRRNSVMYEVHVGTYTPEGTFDALIPHLPRLRDFGITTLQLMPVAQFPGGRNWGYDGVDLFAVQQSYGGPAGLQRLVDAAHNAGLAVMLDAVYNHLGPEGNYLWDYGPYFTSRYQGGWGDAPNFDGPHSDHVRRFFIENALYWFEHFHIDGLRLDATHALFDFSAVTFLQQLTATAHDWAAAHNRHVILIAENDKSDRRLLLPPEAGGIGLDGQWLDDVHHVLHNALTGESDGYYADYGDFDLLVKALREGFVLSGQYSPHRQRTHGTSSADIPADRFVGNVQTHDQVGNRMLGERLNPLTDFDGEKLAACYLLTAPYIPLIFMGQEYGETAPFLYFISHTDADLVKAVQKGRAEEFAAFQWKNDPPDPAAEATFQRCKLDHALREASQHAILYRLYRDLLHLRAEQPAFTEPGREHTDVIHPAGTKVVLLERRHGAMVYRGASAYRVVMNFDLNAPAEVHLPADGRAWHRVLDGASGQWQPDGTDRATTPPTIDAAFTLTLGAKGFVIYRAG